MLRNFFLSTFYLWPAAALMLWWTWRDVRAERRRQRGFDYV
jgi:hypothetical protein